MVEMQGIEPWSKIRHHQNSFTDIANIYVASDVGRFSSAWRFTVYFISQSVNDGETIFSGVDVSLITKDILSGDIQLSC